MHASCYCNMCVRIFALLLTSLSTLGGLSNITIQLPPLEELRQYDSFMLEASLACTTPFDASCPIWYVNLYKTHITVI